MPEVIGSAVIRIMPDTSGFSAQLSGQLKGAVGTASQQVGGLTKQMSGLNSQMATTGDTMGRMGTRSIQSGLAMTYGLTRPLVRLAETAVGTAASFEEALKTVAAVSEMDLTDPEDIANYELLSDKAREFGLVGKFSAVEVAQGFTDLGRAGLDVQSMIAAMPAIMNIATVENIKLADASDRLINVFTGFGGKLSTTGESIFGVMKTDAQDLQEEFRQMTDVIALTSAKTTTDIKDLTEAFRYAGPTAAIAGLSFEETAASLGLLAQGGFNASIGGTALRGIITRLAVPTLQSEKILTKFGITAEEAFASANDVSLEDMRAELLKSVDAGTMSTQTMNEALAATGGTMEDQKKVYEDLGLQIFDSAGDMIPLADILEELRNKGARTADVMKLFGQRAGPGMLALMGQTPDKLRELTRDLEAASGASEDMAKIIGDTAAMKFAKAKNALVELSISLGESGMLDFFADAAMKFTSFVTALSKSNPEILKFVLLLGAIVAAMGPVTLVWGLFIKMGSYFVKTLEAVKVAMAAVRAGALLTAAPFIALAALLTGLAIGFAYLVSQSKPLQDALKNLWAAIARIAGPIKELISTLFGGMKEGGGSALQDLGQSFADFFNNIALQIEQWTAAGGLRDFVWNIIEAIGTVKEAMSTLGDLFEQARPAIAGALEKIAAVATAAFKLLVSVVGEVWEGLWNLGEAVLPVIAVAFKVAWEAAGAFLSVLAPILEFLEPLTDIISDVLGPALLYLGQMFLQARLHSMAFTSAMMASGMGVATMVGMSLSAMGQLVSGTMAAMGMIKNAILGVGSFIGSAFTAGVSAASSAIWAMRMAIQTGLGSINLGGVASAMSGVWATLTLGAATAGLAIKDALTKAMVGFDLGRILRSVPFNARGIADVISQALSTAFLRAAVAARSSVSAMWANLTTYMRNGVTTLRAYLFSALPMAMADAIRSGATNLRAAFQSALSGLGGVITSVGSSLRASWLLAMQTLGAATASTFSTLGTTIRTILMGAAADNYTVTERFQLAWMTAIEAVKGGVQGIKNVMATVGPAIAAGFNIAAQGAMAFSQGMMLAEATDLKGKLSALIPIIMSIGTAMTLATGPVGAMSLAITALAALAGTAFGSMDNGVKNLTDGFDGFREALEIEDEAQRVEAFLATVRDELNAIGTENGRGSGFTTVSQSLEAADLSMTQFVNALAMGEEATNQFMEMWRNNTIDDALDQVGVSLTEVDGKFKLVLGEGQLPEYFNSLAEARDRVGESFDKNFTVTQLEGLAGTVKDANTETEVWDATLQALTGTEKDAKGAATDLYEAQKSVGSIFQQTKADIANYTTELKAMVDGIDPAKDLQESKDAFVTSVGQMGDAINRTVGEGQKASFKIPGVEDFSENAIEMRSQLDQLSDSFFDQAAALATNAGSAEEYANGLFAANGALVEMLVKQGATQDEAVILAGQIAELSGVKKIDMYLEYGQVREGQEEIKRGFKSVTEARDGFLKELGLLTDAQRTVPGMGVLTPQQMEELIAGRVAMYGGVPLYGGTVPTPTLPPIQAPGGVAVSPGAVEGMPEQGIPSEVTVKIIFSAVENMDAVLAQIASWATAVSMSLLALQSGITVASNGLASIPAIAAGVAAQSIVSMSYLGAYTVLTMERTATAIATLFGSVARVIALMFTMMGTSVSALVALVVTGFATMASSSTIASLVIVGAIGRIVAALSQIPAVMEAVGTSIARGFSRPFNLIASAVWNPFAGFINSAATSLGLGPLLPANLSIPVFHKGGVAGGAIGDSYDGSRPLGSDEMLALLQKGEGVMNNEMMANLNSAQLSAFKKGQRNWWAVGGPYENGKAKGGNIGDATIPDYAQMASSYDSTIKPLIASITAGYPGNIASAIGGKVMGDVGSGMLDFARGFTDEATAASGGPLPGTFPANFSIAAWKDTFAQWQGRAGSYGVLIEFLRQAGIPHLVNSTVRPGAITVSGNLSNHARGRAVDFGAPNDANYDSPGLLRINRAFTPFMGQLAELIYSGPGGINNRDYSAAVDDIHHNHVHVALAKGGIVHDAVMAMIGEGMGSEVVLPLNNPVRALQLARASGLFSVLAKASGPGSGAVQTNVAPQGVAPGEAGFLGGAGNTYHIYGVTMDQVKAEIAARDAATLRGR